MNIFELLFFLGIIATIVVASKLVGSLFGINGWFVTIPLAIGAVCALRWLGGRLAGRRRDPWPVGRGKNSDDR